MWIIRHQAENEGLSHTKIALDFSSGTRWTIGHPGGLSTLRSTVENSELPSNQIEPLDNSFIACVKAKYRWWLNLKILTADTTPVRDERIKKKSQKSFRIWP